MQPVAHDPLLSHKTIGRLSLYRRLLNEQRAAGHAHIFSHQLAAMTGGTGAQVRRDLMVLGYTGSSTKGYAIHDLLTSIGDFLDAGSADKALLVGIGNLGRSLLAHFASRATHLTIVAAFDNDLAKVNRVIGGCRCHPVDTMREVVTEACIEVAILAVPPHEAQDIATALYTVGVRGFVNFAPVYLELPEDAFVEQVDLTMALDKAAFFGHANAEPKEAHQ